MEDTHRLNPMRKAKRKRSSGPNPFQLAAEAAALRAAVNLPQSNKSPVPFDDAEYKKRFIE